MKTCPHTSRITWKRLGTQPGLLLCAALALAVAVILFCFDPARFHFYPTCVLHQATGLLCPGCGSLRALHQLLHGHFATAFHLNPLLVCTLPVAGIIASRHILRKLSQKPPPALPSPAWLGAFLVASIAFGIWRNLPGGAQ